MPDAVSATTSVVPYQSTPATDTVDRPDQLGKDTFLKLLVAQLKYQDPSNPASSTEFMSQTATFSQVEKMDELVTQNAAMLASQRSLSAGAMVGQTVSYLSDTGETKSGVVTSVLIDPKESSAMIGGAKIPMGRITEVSLPSSSTLAS